MDKAILILSLGIIAILLLLFVFLVSLFVVRTIENRAKTRMNRYIHRHQQYWFTYLVEGDRLKRYSVPRSHHDRMALEQLLISYTQTIADPEVLLRISALAERYLLEYYRKQLKSKKWSKRMNTLYRIADFQLHPFIPDILNTLEFQTTISIEEYLQLIKILIAFNHERAMSYLLHPKYPLGEFEYKKLLFGLETSQFTFFIAQFTELPSTLQHILIETIGMKYAVEHVPFLESLLRDDKSEIRVRALKSIAQIGFIPRLETYLPFLHSQLWEERLMLAKLLALVPAEESVQYLQSLLHDPSYWVRSQATQILSNSKQGIDALKTVISTSDDRYAKDIARQALQKE